MTTTTLTITAANLAIAIATVRSSRKTHVDWLEWYERHPEEELKHGAIAGDAKHHREAIAGYDQVISVLESVQGQMN